MLRRGGQMWRSRRFASSVVTRTKALINGEWVGGEGGSTFEVLNPANGQVIAHVPSLQIGDVEKAISGAHHSFSTCWSQTTAKERSALLRNWFNIINKNIDYLSELVHLESGKPVAEAKAEVIYGNSFIEWFSEEARRVQGEVIASPVKSKEILHIKQPAGVASLITPWNFPMAMITRKAGAALAAGCTVVIKPAEETPLTALALADYAQQAGIPNGVVNVVTCDRSGVGPIGQLLCESPKVAVVTFTGSTDVGKLLYSHCAKGVKRIALELGGNAPFIVFKTADIEKAVLGAVASKFRNCGQTCVSANRFIIEDTVYEDFVQSLTKYISNNVGFSSKSMELGPLINQAQYNKVETIVNDALSKGAKLLCGGKGAHNKGRLFFEPTVLTNISPDMMCYNMEIFGPVVPCIKVANEEEALKVANSVNSGLAGYFFSRDVNQIFRVGRALEVGMVGINEGAISTTEAAFGGIKESGIGREGSHYGMDEFLNVKYMCVGGLN